MSAPNPLALSLSIIGTITAGEAAQIIQPSSPAVNQSQPNRYLAATATTAASRTAGKNPSLNATEPSCSSFFLSSPKPALNRIINNTNNLISSDILIITSGNKSKPKGPIKTPANNIPINGGSPNLDASLPAKYPIIIIKNIP